MGEQPLVRALAQREVEPHLVERDPEPLAEPRPRRCGSSTGPPGRAERQADVRASRPPRRRARRGPGRPGRRTSPRRAGASCPSIGPAIACISAGTAPAVAATTFSATGSTRPRQAGSVPSTHSARLHASAPALPAGSAVTGSSHTSARRTASSTAAPVGRRRGRVAALDDGLPGDVAGEVPVDRAAFVRQQLAELLQRCGHVLRGRRPRRRTGPRRGSRAPCRRRRPRHRCHRCRRRRRNRTRNRIRRVGRSRSPRAGWGRHGRGLRSWDRANPTRAPTTLLRTTVAKPAGRGRLRARPVRSRRSTARCVPGERPQASARRRGHGRGRRRGSGARLPVGRPSDVGGVRCLDTHRGDLQGPA